MVANNKLFFVAFIFIALMSCEKDQATIAPIDIETNLKSSHCDTFCVSYDLFCITKAEYFRIKNCFGVDGFNLINCGNAYPASIVAGGRFTANEYATHCPNGGGQFYYSFEYCGSIEDFENCANESWSVIYPIDSNCHFAVAPAGSPVIGPGCTISIEVIDPAYISGCGHNDPICKF